MKQFYALIMAAMTVVPAMAQETTTAVASFENVQGIELNADSVYYGSTEDTIYSKTYVSWGDTVTTYYSQFKDGPFTLTQNITPKWASWSGFAISACKDTTYKALTPGQFHNVAGGAYEGNNFVVLYGSSDSIIVDKGTSIKGFYVTNSAYSRNSFLYGDKFSKAFSADSCFFNVTVEGVKDDNSVVSKVIDLASYSNGKVNYIDGWQWVDLSEFGEVRALKFVFDGSDKSYGYLNTPTYLCIDNLTADVTTGIADINRDANAIEVARYSLNGTRLSAPQKGINIVKMSDGTTRKVLVK